MASLIPGEPLRVLLVSPYASLLEEVRAALEATGDHRFYWVSQPDLALARGQDLAPHLVLLDDDLDGANMPALVRQLAARLPAAAIIILVSAGPDAMTAARDAVLAGARSFVTKPVRGDELTSTIRLVLGRRVALAPAGISAAPAGRVILFSSAKGGTGRTTLAINTAISLTTSTHQPVVLVDADYAAPAIDVQLNLHPQRDIRDLLPKLNQLDAELVTGVLAVHSSGVRVLAAPPSDELDYPPTLPQVQQVIAWLRRLFPWVLVDLGLPLDEAAYAFLDAADRVVVSVLPEMDCLRNTRLMLGQFAARHYPSEKVWPLLNRAGMPAALKAEDIVAYLGEGLRETVPDDQVSATDSVNRGVPMVIAHRRRPVCRAYRDLAQQLVADRQVADRQVADREIAARPAEDAGRTAAPLAPVRPGDVGPAAVSAGPEMPTPAAGDPAPPARGRSRRLKVRAWLRRVGIGLIG